MTDYSKLTVVKLKDILKERGLPLTGLKAALIARLVEDDQKVNDPPDEKDEKDAPTQPEEQDTKQDDIPIPSPATQTQPEVEQAAPEVSLADDPPASTVQTLDGSGSPDASNVEDQATETSAKIPPSSEPKTPVIVPKSPSLPPETVEPEKQSSKSKEAPTQAPLQVSQSTLSETDGEKVVAQTQESTLTSVDREELIEDSRKRKRRSQSPAPSSIDAAIKKAKTLDGSPRVTLPEDYEVEKAVPGVAQTSEVVGEENEKPTLVPADTKDPSSSIDDESKQPNAAATDKPQSPSKPSPTNAKFKGLFAAPPSANAAQIEHDPSIFQDRDISPALHPATTALYIRNFMRPLHPGTLKDHLENLAKSGGGSSEQEVISEFFLDGIKTHSLVRFSSISSASRVRLALHERVWPDERTRKALWVDYIPEEKIKKWIEVEQEAGGGRGVPQKRWEVVYEQEGDGVAAYLQEADGSGQRGSLSLARGTDSRRNGPPGPASSEQKPVNAIAPKADYGRGFTALDDLFKSTAAKPKLYYQPVSESIADERLDKLAEGRGGGRGDEMRRFTFEGSMIVDNGSEYGSGWRGGGGRGRGGYSRGYSGRGGYSRADTWRDYR